MEQKTITINGFDEKEICSLYQFLDFYEDNGLKKCNEGDAISRVPSLIEIKAVMNSFTHNEKKTSELDLIDTNSLCNTLYYTKWISEFMGFLYHLRNSIAHAKIIKDGDNVIIIDYNNSSNLHCTAKGIIKYEIIQKITQILKNN